MGLFGLLPTSMSTFGDAIIHYHMYKEGRKYFQPYCSAAERVLNLTFESQSLREDVTTWSTTHPGPVCPFQDVNSFLNTTWTLKSKPAALCYWLPISMSEKPKEMPSKKIQCHEAPRASKP